MSENSKSDGIRSVPAVPREYGGKWIAWNHAGTEILAAADDLATAEAFARKTGECRPRMEKIPRAEVRIVGGVRR
ncbi:MAG: hypothetical protein AB7U97_22540 [Pirellulales bacterium]